MIKTKIKNPGLYIFGSFFALFLVFFIFLSTEAFTSVIAILTVFILLITLYISPYYFFITIIALRALADKFANQMSITFEDKSFNALALLGLFFIVVIFLFLFLKKINMFKNNTFAWWFLSLILIWSSSIFFSISIQDSLYEIVRFINFLAIFLFAFYLFKKKPELKISTLRILIGIGLIPIVLGVFQKMFSFDLLNDSESYGRIHGTFTTSAEFGLVCVIVFILSLYFIINEKESPQKITRKQICESFNSLVKGNSGNFLKKSNLIFGITAFLSFFALLLSQARGPIVVAVFVCFVIGILKVRKILFILVLTSLIVFFSSKEIRERIDKTIDPPSYTSSIDWRYEQWYRAFCIYNKSPLLGHGIGTEKKAYKNNFREEEYGSSYTHNDYLKILMENGLIGLLAFLFMWVGLLLNLFLNYLKTKKIYTLIIGSFLVGLTGLLFVDNVLKNTFAIWLLMVLLAVYFADVSLERKGY